MLDDQNLPPIEPLPEAPAQGFTVKPTVNRVLDPRTEARVSSYNMPMQDSFFKRNMWFILGACVGFLVIGILAYLALRPSSGGRTQEAKIDLVITPPKDLKTGDAGIFQIDVTNQDKEDIKNLKIEMVLPDDAEVQESSSPPENSSKTLFNLPDLKSGNNLKFFMKVKLGGSAGDESKVSAVLAYKFTSSNLEFKKHAETALTLAQAGVDISIVGPTESTASQLVLFTVKYKNNSGKAITNGRIKLDLPDGFSLDMADPEVTSQPSTWDVGNVAVDEEKEITFQGTFKKAQAMESKTFKATLQIPSTDTGYYALSSTTFVTKIISFPLLITAGLQGGAATSVDPGQRLEFVVNYQNNTQVPQQAVNMKVVLEGKALDLATIQAEGAQVDNNGVITWDAAADSKLEALASGQEGQFRFSVNVKNPPTKDSTKNLIVKVKPTIYSKASPAGFPGAETTLKINSFFKPSTVLTYVSGSLPLSVGEETTYKVTLQAKSGINDLKGAQMSGFVALPKGSFIDSSLQFGEGTKATFDPATSKLTWDIGNIPAFSGTFSKPITLTFNVNIKPTQTMKGKEVLILKDISTKATDTFTSKDFQTTVKNVTSINAEGNAGSGGTVQ